MTARERARERLDRGGRKAQELVERVRTRARPPQPAITGGAQTHAVSQTELSKRRDELSDQFVELQWDIGGMVYEMVSRDHFRADVLVRHAAKLQAVDAELGEVERLLQLEDAGAAGKCVACGALHARGAVFCWQCGKELMAQESVILNGGSG